MSKRNGKPNFIEAHWDWLAALAGVALAAASVVFNFVLAEEDDSVTGLTGNVQGKSVDKVDMTSLKAASKEFGNPALTEEIPGDAQSFLAPGVRVFCLPADGTKSCGKPIPFPVEKCPFCGASQKETEKPTEDHDGDGLTDEWETKYGLDPADASDADGDLDSDGFTNIEEFKAGTDPKDPKSHPDYLPLLKLDPNLSQKFTSLMFVRATPTPNGTRMYFKDPRFSKAFNSGNFSVIEGEEIKATDPMTKKLFDTGFTAKTYTQKQEQVKIPGSNATRSRDLSSVTVVRRADGKSVTLAIGAKKTQTDVEAKILFDRIQSKGVQEFPVVKGSEFEINGNKYKVEMIEKEAQGFTVVVTSLASGEKRAIKSQ